MLSNSSPLQDSLCVQMFSNATDTSSNYPVAFVSCVLACALLAPLTVANGFILAATWKNPFSRLRCEFRVAGLAVTDYYTGILTGSAHTCFNVDVAYTNWKQKDALLF